MSEEMIQLVNAIAADLGIDANIIYISIAIGALFAAFFSFRLLKFTVVTYGVCFGFMIGLVVFGILTGDVVVGLVVGVLLAIILGILSLSFFKFMLYLYGALLGMAVGSELTYVLLLLMGVDDIVAAAASGIVALVFAFGGALLLYKYQKPYLIIGTAFEGTSMAAAVVSYVAFGNNEIAAMIFAIVGLVIGAYAMMFQFKMCEGYELNL